MAAALVLLPLALSLEFPNLNICPLSVIINTSIVALLAGSTIPTPCLKKLKLKSAYKQMILLLLCILLVGLLIRTWLFSIIICVAYIFMIIASWGFYLYFIKNSK